MATTIDSYALGTIIAMRDAMVEADGENPTLLSRDERDRYERMARAAYVWLSEVGAFACATCGLT